MLLAAKIRGNVLLYIFLPCLVAGKKDIVLFSYAINILRTLLCMPGNFLHTFTLFFSVPNPT